MATHQELVEQGRALVQAAPQAYFDFDVEADGKPGYGSLRSIGAVSPWGDTYYAELRPDSELWIPENHEFCEQHGLERTRLLEEGREPEEVAREFVEWTQDITHRHQKEGMVLTAFNASFDFPWVDLLLTKAGITPNPFGVAGYCIKSLAMALPGEYNWRKTQKGNLPTFLIPEGDFTHNALEDSVYQQKIHFALAATLDRLIR